jgi:hypothetical protein
VKTLSSTINALFQKRLSEAEIALLLGRLQAAGAISINETKVSYTLEIVEQSGDKSPHSKEGVAWQCASIRTYATSSNLPSDAYVFPRSLCRAK